MPKFPHVALVGTTRGGQDAVAALLVERYQYTRLAFADRMRQAALTLDPLIPLTETHRARLSALVTTHGWDKSEAELPEVHRILQHFGKAIRGLDPDFWVRPLVANVRVATEWNLPVVVPDVAHPNEAEWLTDAGAVIVRVDRPGPYAGDPALSGIAARYALLDTGTPEDLAREVDAFITELRSDT